MYVFPGHSLAATGFLVAFFVLAAVDYSLYRIRAREYRRHDELYFSGDETVVRAEDEIEAVVASDEESPVDREYDDRWEMAWLHEARFRRLSEIVSPLEGIVIDAGCGSGKLLRAIRNRSRKQLAGFDVAIFSSVVRANASDAGFACASVEIAPIRTGVADVVVCSEVLEHLRYPEKALRECWRILRPGGIFVTSVPSAAVFPQTINPFILIERALTPFTGARRGHKPHAILIDTEPRVVMALHKLYDRGEFLALTQSAPFEIEKVESVAFNLGPIEPLFRAIRKAEKAWNGKPSWLFDASFAVYRALVRFHNGFMRRLPIIRHMGAVVLIVARKKG